MLAAELDASRPSTPSAPPPLLPRFLPTASIALAISLLAWPSPLVFLPNRGPNYFMWGLDFSWQVALHLAAIDSLQWGRDIVFSYGPLGFLTAPLVISRWTASLGLAYVVLATLSLATVSLLAFRRLLPLPLAALAALAAVLLAGWPIAELTTLSALLLSGLALGGALSPRATRLVPPLVAALAAVQLLVKFNGGLLLAATVPFILLADPRDLVRRTLVCSAVFCAVLLIAWTGAGQSPTDFPQWLRAAVSVTSGYTEAMAIEESSRRWEYFGFAGVLCGIGLGLLVGSAGIKGPARLSLVCILGLASLMFFKAGFVRHWGYGHSTVSFSFLAIAPLLVPWRGRWRLLGVALAVAAGVMLGMVRDLPPARLFDVSARVRELSFQMTTLASGWRSRDMQDWSRARIREAVSLPPELFALVRGQRVHVDPQDVAVAWAYGLDWTPVPMFQSHLAFTPWLDRLNAQRLADSDAPDRILRRPHLAIDGRNALWQAPEYALARLCRYQEVATAGVWQVLARAPDRCGAERELGVATLRPGERLAVPAASAPDRIVVARLSEQMPIAHRLRTMLFKPAGWLDGVVADRRERLVRANLAGPLLLRIPMLSGWHSRFGGGLSIESFAIEGSERPFAVRFAEIQMRPSSRLAGPSRRGTGP